MGGTRKRGKGPEAGERTRKRGKRPEAGKRMRIYEWQRRGRPTSDQSGVDVEWSVGRRHSATG